MVTREEAIRQLQSFHQKGEHVCMIVWSREDVIGYAKNERGHPMKVSNEEADEILDSMESHHDASQGITWLTIDVYLDDLQYEREKAKKEQNAKEKVQID